MTENTQAKEDKDAQVKQITEFITMTAMRMFLLTLIVEELWREAEKNYKPTLWDKIRFFPLRIYYMIEDAIEKLEEKILDWLRA
ncbi:MAG: hypothetical protein JHC26_00300, partial [Thermofilum sp.]|uniref:hypothetical protein n=1 Tax=Thermofilum sp. TaxID=1961369 RepID=UPI00258570FE